MADDRTDPGKPDRFIQINLLEKYEFERWKKRLNISGQALAGAIRVVGPMVEDVKTYLEGKRSRSV